MRGCNVSERIVAESIEENNKWMHRAVLMARVLNHFGYNVHGILQADDETLKNGIYKDVGQAIQDFQVVKT